jgi:hypothetical protein
VTRSPSSPAKYTPLVLVSLEVLGENDWMETE